MEKKIYPMYHRILKKTNTPIHNNADKTDEPSTALDSIESFFWSITIDIYACVESGILDTGRYEP